MDSVTIIVSGDLVEDWHLYAGEGASLAASSARDTVQLPETGGAELIRRLLTGARDELLRPGDTAVPEAIVSVHEPPSDQVRTTKPDDRAGPKVLLGVHEPSRNEARIALPQSYLVWAPYPAMPGDAGWCWRVRDALGYGGHAGQPGPLPDLSAELRQPHILVLDDGGYVFRREEWAAAWHLPSPDAAPRGWIVLKHCRPLAQGHLWHRLRESHADRLICLVTADDLRAEGAAISRGRSWDETAEQTRGALRSHPVWSRLLDAAHLVVSFGADGALWIARDARGRRRARLVFDAARAEGEWAAACEGGVVGLHATFTAAIVHHVARGGAEPDLAPGIRAGLEAMRDLHRLGHGAGQEKAGGAGAPPAGFPAGRLAKVIAAGKADLPKAVTVEFAAADIPWPVPDDRAQPVPNRRWSILEAAHRLPDASEGPPIVHPQPLLGLAMEVARRGTVALRGLPKARFGKYLTADRAEIEALRNLRRLMRGQAVDPKPPRPLNLAVFGPPGAGKSFAVRELAREVFGEKAWLEFNLAQFSGPEELYDAFHRIRDLVLAGQTPVAFWDEFDSQDLRWLRYLLAPMQDGAFSVGQLVHAIGKCVFVFAGGTSPRYRDFAARGSSETFRAAKGPDFVSRLDGHLDVLGPNRRLRPAQHVVDGKTVEVEEEDLDDVGMPLRRALMLRGELRLNDEHLDADDGLLRALLAVPSWRHGSRSFTKLVARLRQGGKLRRDALPPATQLDMLVEAEGFGRLLAPRLETLDDVAFAARVETLAAAIHRVYLKHMRDSGLTPAGPFASDFDGLGEEAKEDNRAAARRMPGVLALAGLALCESDPLPEEVVRRHLVAQCERLAEAEHDGWRAHREATGWKLGPRDDRAKYHPSLVPYGKLNAEEQAKDRNTVLQYPRFAWEAGLRIGLLR